MNNEFTKPTDSKTKTSACAICDALGFPPPCKGHGGGSKGSDDSTDERESDKEISYKHALPSSTQNIVLSLALSSLNKNANSTLTASHDLADENIRPTKALITINPIDNTISVCRSGLPTQDYYLLTKLIKTEIEYFEKSMPEQGMDCNTRISMDNNNLVIQMPNAKLFNALVSHLIRTNLLPKILQEPIVDESRELTNTSPEKTASSEITNTGGANFENTESFSPTPFSMMPE